MAGVFMSWPEFTSVIMLGLVAGSETPSFVRRLFSCALVPFGFSCRMPCIWWRVEPVRASRFCWIRVCRLVAAVVLAGAGVANVVNVTGVAF